MRLVSGLDYQVAELIRAARLFRSTQMDRSIFSAVEMSRLNRPTGRLRISRTPKGDYRDLLKLSMSRSGESQIPPFFLEGWRFYSAIWPIWHDSVRGLVTDSAPT